MARERKHYRPFLKVAAATLGISARIVARDTFGKLEQQNVDDWLAIWHKQVFDAGQGTLACFGVDHVKDAAKNAADVAAGKRAYVVMTNHSSLLDVPTVIATYPGRIRMVSKRELGLVPIWGQAMRAAGVVFVDRKNREQSIAALEVAKTQMREGTSIWIAPEGTRTRNGQLGPLKKGGFHLALQLGAPIAPAWITGTKAIIDPDSFGVSLHGHVTIRWGAPIETTGVDLATVMERVRTSLLALQQESEAALAAR